MINNFKRAIWLKALQVTLLSLLIGATPLSSYAAHRNSDEKSEEFPMWFVVVAMPDVMETVKEIDGDWIAIQNLAISGKPDSEFDGLILRPINCVCIHKKEVLNKFIKDDYEIVDRDTWNIIPIDVFREMPVNKIMSLSIIKNPNDGKVTVRAFLNNQDLKRNPVFDFSTDLNVTTGVRLWEIMNEPGFHP